MFTRLFLFYGALLASAPALTIQLDYRYDTNLFFSAAGNPGGATGAAQARAALQAAADRWGAIINQPLSAVTVRDDTRDVRIGFSHPGTGLDYEVSSANSVASDALAGFDGAANEYRGTWSIPADTIILYAGARLLSSSGIGGTGTGINFTSVLDDPNSIHNRGFNVGCDTCNPLPVWGGTITFNSAGSSNWHFNHTTAAGPTGADFYSIALHEIGHVLGMNTGWDDWRGKVSAGTFTGTNAVAAYNADNGGALTSLLLQPGGNHWNDGSYDSVIFSAGNPNYVGTVGAGNLQDLLMEPIADFTFPAVRRFEITNVDVGGLRDVGWSTITASTPAALVISSVTLSSMGTLTLTWKSQAGASYTVQTSPDMQQWSNVNPAVPATGASTSWPDHSAGSSEAKFYRVKKN